MLSGDDGAQSPAVPAQTFGYCHKTVIDAQRAVLRALRRLRVESFIDCADVPQSGFERFIFYGIVMKIFA